MPNNQTQQEPGIVQEPTTFTWKDPKSGVKTEYPKMVGDLNLESTLYGIIEKSNVDSNNAKKNYDTQMSSFKALLDDKESTMATMQAKLQEIKEADMTAEDKAKEDMKRVLDKHTEDNGNLQKLADSNFDLFKRNKIDNDIFTELGEYSLHSNKQTKSLISSMLQPSLIDNEGVYQTELTISIDGEVEKLSPKDAISKFLALPENANLLKNNLKPGGGTSTSGGRVSTDGKLEYARSELKSNPALQKEYQKKLMSGEQVSINNDK